MSIELQQQLRLQQEDATSAVEDLTGWLAEMERTEAAARMKAHLPPELPPVRGTAPPPSSDANSKETPKEDPMTVFKERGNTYFKAGKYKEAIEQYTRGIALDPRGKDTHVLYGNRSMAYLNMASLREAEADATVSTELSRTYTKGYYRRAMARERMGNLSEAILDYERVLVLEPTNVEAKRALTEALAKVQEKKKDTQEVKRKKLIVEEVEEDEDEDVAPPVQAPPLTQSQLDAQRRCEEALKEVEKAKKEKELAEREQAKQPRARVNPRVEEISDEVPATRKNVSAPTTRTASAGKAENQEVPSQAKSVANGNPTSSTSNPTQPTNSATTKRATTGARRMPFELPPLTKEQLSIPPRNMLEYEKMLVDIAQSQPAATDDAAVVRAHRRDLFAHYFRTILPDTYPTFFRSNLTSVTVEFVIDALRFDYTVNDPAYAVHVLTSLLKTPRFDDLLMFCDAYEKESLRAIFQALHSASETNAEMRAKVRTLQEKYFSIVGEEA